MKLRLPEETAWPRLRARRLLGATALALGLALGLTGCGPGTGGTGTGYPPSSALAGNAMWAQGAWSSVASSADSASAMPLPCASPAPCASTVVMLDVTATGIRVDAGCWTFTYDGPWGDAASNPLRMTGWYTAPGGAGGAATRTADLLIETRDPDLVLTVFDAGGAVLQGPVTLMRSPGGAGASSVSGGCAGPQGPLVNG